MGVFLALFAILCGGIAGLTCTSSRPIRRVVLATLTVAVLGLAYVVYSSFQKGTATVAGELPIALTTALVMFVGGLSLSVALLIGRALRGRTSWVAATVLGGLGAIATIVGLFMATS